MICGPTFPSQQDSMAKYMSDMAAGSSGSSSRKSSLPQAESFLAEAQVRPTRPGQVPASGVSPSFAQQDAARRHQALPLYAKQAL